MGFQVEKLEKYTFFTPQSLEKKYQNHKKKAWIQNFALLDTLKNLWRVEGPLRDFSVLIFFLKYFWLCT